MKEINSIEDVFNINGTKQIPTFSEIKEEKRKSSIAKWIWEEIVEAYNKLRDPEYKADWSDWNQLKNWPWTEIVKDETTKTGFRFSYSRYNYSDSDAYVGARLAFANSDDVMDALKKFEQEYIASIIY